MKDDKAFARRVIYGLFPVLLLWFLMTAGQDLWGGGASGKFLRQLFSPSLLGPDRALAASLPAPEKAEAKPERQRPDPLMVNLWMQTSAEYEALCLQTYNFALSELSRELERLPRPATKPLAVIMDLDETVLDNLAYQGFLAFSGLDYSDATWNSWVRDHIDEVGLVPGAKEFIAGVENQGVTVVYISNRQEADRQSTVRALLKVGLAKKDSDFEGGNAIRLLLKKDTSSKEARRAEVLKRFAVIALVGDNLEDFSAEFDKNKITSAEERRAKVESDCSAWGARWFVLPNPIYGDWTRYVDWNHPENSLRRMKQ